MSNQTKKAGSNPRQLRRSARYGKLVPAWRWRTTPARLERMEELREKLGISKTELIETAIDQLLERSA